MPLSFSPFYPLFLCQLNIPQPSCSPHFLKQPTPPCFPLPFHLFLCRLLCNHLIYLSEWLWCIKEPQIKTDKPFEISLHLQKSVVKVGCLPFTWTACMAHCMTVQWATAPSPSVFAMGPCLMPCLGCSFSSNITLLPKSDVPHSAPKLPVPLPVCWSCFHPCLLPCWPPVPISVSFISWQPQPPCTHHPGQPGHPCYQEPPGSSTSRPPGTFQAHCPWLLWLFLCASHRHVAAAMGATCTLQG